MARKPLINFNVPKAGRITTDRIIGFVVVGGIVVAAWNWSNKIPGAGPYIVKGKEVLLRGLGFQYPLRDALI